MQTKSALSLRTCVAFELIIFWQSVLHFGVIFKGPNLEFVCGQPDIILASNLYSLRNIKGTAVECW